MLKFTTIEKFPKSWGTREFPLGVSDAPILDGPYRIKLPDGERNYWYVQQQLKPLTVQDLPLVDAFEAALKKQGRHRFWDFEAADPEHKVSQFGFEMKSNGDVVTSARGKPKMLLLDYNAIVRQGETPPVPREPNSF